MSAEAIEVTLRSSDGLDGFEERRFMLRPNATIPIGRASKNTQKPELMMSPNNAFIDSPVISRAHAVLSTNGAPPASSVYITDNGSMHGTTVNGAKLEPQRALKLNNGDLLQFGIDVTRNENFYIARKYVFECTLPDNSFSRGFSVPDVETSEDEEVDSTDIMSPPIHHYGTPTNPVIIDDSEDVPPEIIEIEEDEEIVIHSAPAASSEETEEQFPSSPREIHMASEERSHTRNEPTGTRYASVVDASSDEADDNSIYSSDGEESHDGRNMSQAGSESDSDEEPASDAEESDEEVDEDADAVRRMKMVAMLNHEQEKAINQAEPIFPTRPSAPVVSLRLPSPPTVQAPRRQEPPGFFSTSVQAASKDAPKAPEPEVPTMGAYMGPISMFDDNFGSTVFGTIDSPLPPRPAAPKPMHWGVPPEYNNPFAPRESNSFRLFSEDLPPSNIFTLPNPNYASDMFSNFSDPVGSEAIPPKPYSLQQPQSLPDNPWSLKTPPPNEPLASTETAAPTASASSDISLEPQPARRTKVSIPEIVEEAPQPPLTPTSVTGSLKRKADALEEEVVEEVIESSPLPVADAPEAPAPAVAESSTTSTEERPKKRPRGRLGSAVKNMAAYLIPGTAVAIGLLTQLPGAFFEP